MRHVYWGDSLIREGEAGGQGGFVERGGETFYRIKNYHKMPPFLLSIVSGFDHWMFVSSSGGLTCGRNSPETALFPYETDDKIHDAWATTGPYSQLLVEKDGKTFLWKPFGQDVDVYRIERNLYKNLTGNKLVFEEINRDLELSFSYTWTSSEQFGFIKDSSVRNLGTSKVRLDLLDGLRNVLPYGVSREMQATRSTLLDAYKQAERIPDLEFAVYTLSSIPTDRAEPNEALKASVVWSLGLEQPRVLLSTEQLDAFGKGHAVCDESFIYGRRGAFLVQSSFDLTAGKEKNWLIVADVDLAASGLQDLLRLLRDGVATEVIRKDVDRGTLRLLQLAGSSDACQLSSDSLVTTRHFSNTLFNIMRGGVFRDEYRVPAGGFLDFLEAWNAPVFRKFKTLITSLEAPLDHGTLSRAAAASGDTDLERIALEYLPLTFSRRHGDPSRPWNQFSIDVKNADGSDRLSYQGNWRDIFQNWEALAISYPGYIESFVAKFVNASTADGYNPYRISTNGFDWEVLDPTDPWSNIGYWGDHQVNYLLRFIDQSQRYHPGKLNDWFSREIFVYADVPYRLKEASSLRRDPRNSIEYDADSARVSAGRVADVGCDGKLVTLADGSIYKVNLLEKLLVMVLSKMGNFVPGGGIWMNTQRPEWNDANNALVGNGVSMVTLCYLRRFLLSFSGLLSTNRVEGFAVSDEVVELLDGTHRVLKKHAGLLSSGIEDEDRKVFMDELGKLNEDYRARVYSGFSGKKATIRPGNLVAFIGLAQEFLDDSIALNRREDGLYHSYNLVHFGAEGYGIEHLNNMLEGQVAVLNSGFLSPGEILTLLDGLKNSNLYRPEKSSYLLYPFSELPRFLEKNCIPPEMVDGCSWIQSELSSGCSDIVEEDLDGGVHFNSAMRNAEQLHAALARKQNVTDADVEALTNIYEGVFAHRRFTGRSGTMYKYEGLGCIYWHMVSKMLLATGETIAQAAANGTKESMLGGLIEHFDEIKRGLGGHQAPAQYGAFPTDPYSHTPSFAGVQQPGMTGQVKEDVLTRFCELGVVVVDGVIHFRPVTLRKNEFLSGPDTWHFSVGDTVRSEKLEAGSMAFSYCGVPVIYRMATEPRIKVFTDDGDEHLLQSNSLDRSWSQTVFRRDKQIRKIIVDLPESALR